MALLDEHRCPERLAVSTASARRSTLTWVLIGLLLALRVGALVGVLSSGQEEEHSILGGDARRYHQIATAHGTPYLDFAVEYPPAAVALIELTDSDDDHARLVRLGVTQLAFDIATAATLGWAWGRRVAVSYLLLGLAFLPYPFIYLRVDLLSVFLAAVGLALVYRARDHTGGILLAVSVFAKLWPIVLAPLFLVERKTKALAAWALAGAAGLAAWVSWAGIGGPIDVLSFRGATGWQVESLPGILLHMADPQRAHVESGAWRTGVMPTWSRPLLTLLSFGFAGLAWWLARRRRQQGAPELVVYALAPLAALLSLLIFAPIISPQYLLWLLPFAALLAARGDRLLATGMFIASALSTAGLATIGHQIRGELIGTLPILARNVVLVAMFAVALAQLAGIARSVATASPSS
ncbi:MAG: glycosyltransferase 87 family protein [Acidimicrobiales bacterium]|nr:glycosyltransferase 87 family protein [Acidimicrobiales bacterium]